jgi:hypothetical protein
LKKKKRKTNGFLVAAGASFVPLLNGGLKAQTEKSGRARSNNPQRTGLTNGFDATRVGTWLGKPVEERSPGRPADVFARNEHRRYQDRVGFVAIQRLPHVGFVGKPGL